jgi:hypothetical protein
MFHRLYLLIFIFLFNQKAVIAMSPTIKININSNSNFYQCKQRLYNTFLRILIHNDYKTIKQKVNNTYQEFLTNYYNNCQAYYSLDETDLFVIDSLVQIIL